MSSARFTRVSRATQYSRERVTGTSVRIAATKAVGPLADTTTPAARSRATSATAKAARSTPRSSAGAVTRDAVGAPPG